LIEFDEFAVLVEGFYKLSAGLAATDERYPDPYPDPYTADGYTQTLTYEQRVELIGVCLCV
jgi:hypothetical protein